MCIRDRFRIVLRPKILILQLLQRVHERLRYIAPAVFAKSSVGVRQGGFGNRLHAGDVLLKAALGQAAPGKTKRGPSAKGGANAHILDLEAKLRDRLGTKVALRYRKGKGSVDIKFFNDEDLQRILETLGIQAD